MSSKEEKDRLVDDITMEELHFVVFSMHPNKALGLDGFNPDFYQKNWEVINLDLLNFLNLCLKDPQHIKKLTLIPKTIQPSSISNYKPISLCNVFFRIFSKFLANRLKKCIDQFISPFKMLSLNIDRLVTMLSL